MTIVDRHHRGASELRSATVLCADAPGLDRALDCLKESGIKATGLTRLAELEATSARSDLIIMFTDGYDDSIALSHLRHLERWVSGPGLIAVTDREAPLWRPSVAREHPAMVIREATSTKGLLDAVALCAAALDERDDDLVEVELPFTD